MKNRYVIGIDYGTLSARAAVVSCEDGSIAGEAEVYYPHGVITGALADGTPLGENYALADAGDYRSSLFECIREAVINSGLDRDSICGIGIAATTYTMVPCLSDGTVISELEGFASRPMAYIKLWKHHGALLQAERIKRLHDERGFFPVLDYYGNACNCEFAVPKLLETYEEDPEVFARADFFCDLGEWLALLLTGKRRLSLYSAGFKGMWSREGGWPAMTELEELSPGFSRGFSEKFAGDIADYGSPFGTLTESCAAVLGLNPGIPVAVPTGDGSSPGLYYCINNPDFIAITPGTSVAMSFTAPDCHRIEGINGTVYGGIVPGQWSYDAGTPCAGDMLDWFCRHMVPPETVKKAEESGLDIHGYLSQAASAGPWENRLTVLDWFNGNRSILNNMSLRGGILGLSLETSTGELYCAFIQSIACSLRTVLEHLEACGIGKKQPVLCGSMPLKNSFLTGQIASVLGREVYVSKAARPTAVSAAILASTAAGNDIHEAARKMASAEYITVKPDSSHRREYEELYRRWRRYHDLLGINGEG